MTLEDGTAFEGFSFGARKPVSGEAVFSTSMVGYSESLTDPSYRGQILCLTYPLVGNYGVPNPDAPPDIPRFFESDHVHVRALIVHEICDNPSHWQSTRTLNDWLLSEGTPGVYGVDTRRLARALRERGVMLASITYENESNPRRILDPNRIDLVNEVSIHETLRYQPDLEHRVVVVDCGVKYGILRNLLKRGVSVSRMPHDASADQILQENPMGVVVSNGPGNPKLCGRTIETIRELIELEMPILGICLGNQLIALAAGADTYKMKYGHRSQNQPVLDLKTGRCYITTQNHGYAVDRTTLEKVGLEAWFINANDRSVEGLKHPEKPCWAVQWHPEASPGPTDTEFIFDFFIKEALGHA